jgi:hypothetical protein
MFKYPGVSLLVIEISVRGQLRNNPLETIRALEVTELVVNNTPKAVEWNVTYGEVAIAGSRVDVIARVAYNEDDASEQVGIEIISREKDKDINQTKLQQLHMLGKIHRGFVYLRPLDEVYKSLIEKQNKFYEIPLTVIRI